MDKQQVFCNDKMVEWLPPIRKSAPVQWYSETVHMAEYDLDALHEVPEQAYEDHGAWWRYAQGCNTYVPWLPKDMTGFPNAFWDYLECKLGISAERNCAAAIVEVAYNAGMEPIELFNYLAARTPLAPAGEELW